MGFSVGGDSVVEYGLLKEDLLTEIRISRSVICLGLDHSRGIMLRA